MLVQYTDTFACCPWINVPASLKLSIHILLAPVAEVGSCLGFLLRQAFVNPVTSVWLLRTEVFRQL